MLRLTKLRVEQLLGRFDHEITFPPDWEFVILHGPNGVGKTKLLELLDAIAAGRLHRLINVPFALVTLDFEDGTSLSVVRAGQMALPQVAPDDQPAHLSVWLSRDDHSEPITFRVTRDSDLPSRAELAERHAPVDRIDDDLWFDYNNGDYLDSVALVDRYPVSRPRGFASDVPPEFQEFLAAFNVHLIETQRLLSTKSLPRRAPRQQPLERRTVLSYAEDLTRKLREALAENSRTSQELDRSFPRRVLDRPPPDYVTDEEIRARYQRQSDLRDRLAEIAVLDTSTEVPLPARELESWERRVLWTYLEDAEKKLATFGQLLERVRLMRDIVNSRFLFKKLKIDRDRGFSFVTEEGIEIGADSLSSGEQHELVLLYDLLFNVKPDSMVLIDEPEISLHVTWQQQFLDDIVRIADVASLRFVIATHSPQIIHKWWERTEALYGEQDA